MEPHIVSILPFVCMLVAAIAAVIQGRAAFRSAATSATCLLLRTGGGPMRFSRHVWMSPHVQQRSQCPAAGP
jgi:hypothetical protein